MFLYCVLALIVVRLQYVIGDGKDDNTLVNSYQSSLVEGGKPILRTLPDEEEDEEIVLQPVKESASKRGEFSVDSLRERIKQLFKKHGYKNAKPYVKELVEDAEKEYNVKLHVKVKRNGKSGIDYRNIKRSNSRHDDFKDVRSSSDKDPNWLRTYKDRVRDVLERLKPVDRDFRLQEIKEDLGIDITFLEVELIGSLLKNDAKNKFKSRKMNLGLGDDEPAFRSKKNKRKQSGRHRGPNLLKAEWAKDLKSYVKTLVPQFDQNTVLTRLRPVINVLEAKHDMTVKDIDGEVIVKIKKDGKNMERNRHQSSEEYEVSDRRKSGNDKDNGMEPFDGESDLPLASFSKVEDLHQSEWANDIKAFVKTIVSTHGQQALLQRLRPFLKELEVKHNFTVKDVDREYSFKILKDIDNNNKNILRTHIVTQPPKMPEWLENLYIYAEFLKTRHGGPPVQQAMDHAIGLYSEKYNVHLRFDGYSNEGQPLIRVSSRDDFSLHLNTESPKKRRSLVAILTK